MNSIYSQEAEKGVLGSILCDPTTLDEAVAVLTDDAFFVPAHKIVYNLMLEMQGRGEPIEPIALQQGLVDAGTIGDVGAGTVSELYTFVPTASNMAWYIDKVREKWTLRCLKQVAGEIIQQCTDGGDVAEMLAEAEGAIMKVGDMADAGSDNCVHSVVALKRAVDAIELAKKNAIEGKFITGIPTGFPDLDEMTSGWQPNQLVVVAARPGTGKTSIGRGFIRSACAAGHKVLFFSAEMSSGQTMRADISATSKVPLYCLRSGELSAFQLQTVTDTVGELMGSMRDLWIDDTSSPSVDYIGAKTRRMVSRNGVDMVVIDYLQLCKSNSKRGKDNRQLEVAEISGGLKALAKDLGIPVICLAQLNRKAEDRSDNRPKVSDLRESGAIEQDADTILLIHRPEKESVELVSEKAELIVGKQREGATGTVELNFDRKSVMFTQ
jgi:replicative DNA helicase